jgi:hypothetical protein
MSLVFRNALMPSENQQVLRFRITNTMDDTTNRCISLKEDPLQSAQSKRYQKQLPTEKWKPTDDHAIALISDYLICVREDMNAMIEELGCDKEYAAGLLRAIADGYED